MTQIALQQIWKKFEKPPTRLGIAVMLFLACLVSYMMRVNLSINIIAMVEQPENVTAPDYGKRYNWTQADQSYLLGAYFWGYMVTSLPAGVIAAFVGGRNLVGITTIASAALTVLIPYSAMWSYWALIIVRFAIGVLGGLLYPALHHLVSKWSPPDEKGKFVSSLMGGTFGTVVTWPLCGYVTEKLGYEWSFHVTAIISGVIAIIWFLLVADEPSKHKWIDKAEREYIEDSLRENVTKSSKWPPVKHLLLSVPFWGLLILHYGSMWGLYFLLTAAPKFMGEVLGFNLSKAGFLSSLPYLARLLMAFVYGQIGDVMRRRNTIPVTWMRKLFTISSHIIPGVLLMLMAYLGRDPSVSVALITLSLGLNGAATLTNLANSQDLAPNYAGTLYGIINFVGTTPGFFSPMIVAFFTKEKNTIEQWTYVFVTGGTAYIVPAFIFMVIGSGKVQYWNDLDKAKNKDQEKDSDAGSKSKANSEKVS